MTPVEEATLAYLLTLLTTEAAHMTEIVMAQKRTLALLEQRLARLEALCEPL